MYKSTLSQCQCLVTFGMEHFSEHNCKFHLNQRERAWNVYVPKNRSQLSMSLSLLPPCIIRRFSHLVIWEELTDREETGFQLQPSDVMGTETHTKSDKNKQQIHFTLLPIPLRIPPCENYQFTPSLPPPLLCSQVFNMNQFGSITQ